ncbi:MAG: dihydrofolate reductase [Pseudomonadota bacterium]
MTDASAEAEPPRIVAVVAVARNGVIGRDNGLPWRLRSDLKQFRALTMGKPVIMGRKTFQSIGKPLDGRDNIVVTRDTGFQADGVIVADSPNAALDLGRHLARRAAVDEVCVIGGAALYTELMHQIDRLYVTDVNLEPGGDAHFPAIDPAIWKETSRKHMEAGDRDDASFDIVVYDRHPTLYRVTS